MPQIRHKGTVFAGSPYDPLKHYVEEDDYETDKAYTEADIAKILGDIANSEESPALKSHGIGELILFEKKLYKVSAAIAIGDTLVDGTNIEETDIASEIAALQAEDTSIKESLSNSFEWKFLASQQGSVSVWLPTSWNELNIVIQFPWNSLYGDSFLIQRSHVGNANPDRYSHGYYNTASDAGAWSIEVANGRATLLSCVRNGTEQVANAIMRIYYR